MSLKPVNPIPKPFRVTLTDSKCVSLYFEHPNRYFPHDRGVDFYVRGAVCWPATVGNGNDKATEGFLLVAGQDLSTKRVYIFEQRSFVCIDSIINPDTGMIQYEGITQKLTLWHARYRVDTFYWHDHTDTHKRYLIQLLRSDMLTPKPCFVEVVWYEESQATNALWELITKNRLMHWAGEAPGKGLTQPLYSALLLWRDQGTVLPATKAAMVLAMGYERFPWRKET
jgi:hypothetical protein